MQILSTSCTNSERKCPAAINIIEGGGLNHWTVGGAMDVGPNLSVGISLNFASGSYSYNQTVAESDTRNMYPIPPNDFQQFNYESTYNDDINGLMHSLDLCLENGKILNRICYSNGKHV